LKIAAAEASSFEVKLAVAYCSAVEPMSARFASTITIRPRLFASWTTSRNSSSPPDPSPSKKAEFGFATTH